MIKNQLFENQTKTHIAELCKQHGVQELYVFGSVISQNDFTENSDVDLAVLFDYSNVEGSFDRYMSFKDALEKLFGRPVDLVSLKAVRNKYFVDELDKTKELLYAA